MSVSSTSSPRAAASGPLAWFLERVLAGSGAWRFPLLAVAIVAASIAGGPWPVAADAALRLGIAYLFITHDLAVARAITDTVMVMSEGKIVERGKTEEILRQPLSEAGRALVRASPDLHKALARRITEQG